MSDPTPDPTKRRQVQIVAVHESTGPRDKRRSWGDFVFGRRLGSAEEEEQKIGPLAGVAVLGLDALSSAAYGPEAALTLLLPLGALGLAHVVPITALIIGVLIVVYFSYRQTIAAYSNGGDRTRSRRKISAGRRRSSRAPRSRSTTRSTSPSESRRASARLSPRSPRFCPTGCRSAWPSYGVIVLTLFSALLLIAFGGITDRLIPLFAIGAFLAFTFSQAGMVEHWRRLGGPASAHSLWINAFCALATVSPSSSSCRASSRVAGYGSRSSCRPTSARCTSSRRTAPSASSRPCGRSWSPGRRGTPDSRARSFSCASRRTGSSSHRSWITSFTSATSHPDRDIVVIVPDLVVQRWYHALLHNNRGIVLRSLLRLRGGPRVIVVNTPFYLDEGPRAAMRPARIG
jgi:hypothetical protein